MSRVEHIGKATLYLVDAREIVPTLPDRSVDFIFTDPPYGHNNNNGDLIHRWEAALGRLPCCSDPPLGRPLANDGPDDANDLVRWFFGEANRPLSAGCCCCCCGGGGGPDPQFARSVAMAGRSARLQANGRVGQRPYGDGMALPPVIRDGARR